MTSPQRLRSRIWRFGRWLLGLIVFTLLFLAFRFGSYWLKLRTAAEEGRVALAAELEATEANDPRWRWEQIQEDRVKVPDAENSMRTIMRLPESLRNWPPRIKGLSSGAGGLQEYPASRQLPADSRTAITQFLTNKPDVLKQVLSLQNLPHGRADVQLATNPIETLLPHVQECRNAVLLVELDNERLLHERSTRAAAERIPIMLNAGAALRGEPMVIPQLFRIHIRALACRQVERILGMGEIADEQLQALAARLQSEQAEDVVRCALRGDRAAFQVLFENLESGKVPLADFLVQVTGGPAAKPDLLMRGVGLAYWYRLFEEHAYCLQSLRELLDIAGLPCGEQVDALQDWKETLEVHKAQFKAEKRGVLSVLLLSGAPQVMEAAVRDQAVLSCARIALAAERFRLGQQRWPKELAELCPKYLTEVPQDPFAGAPFRIRATEDGVVIYSVGKDRKDDGGTNLRLFTVQPPGSDLGIQLWNPPQRGLPPEKPVEN